MLRGDGFADALWRRFGWSYESRLWATVCMVQTDLATLRGYLRTIHYGRLRSRLARLRRRYVGLSLRYLHVDGAMYWPRPRQRLFQYRLRWSAYRASTGDLITLLDTGGWREHVMVSWLIAVGRRADLRARIASDLLGDAPCGYRWDYCTALARLGTDQDADLLRRYLDRALLIARAEDPGSDDEHCQRQAMGALLYLDGVLGSSRAQPLLAPGGLWEQWSGEVGAASLDKEGETTARLVAFAAGKDPGCRRQRR
ncbi:DUF6000 family protein [Peterkaempfera sp. SMS 1(5)a]|uniref:DUF6000 family protein n=1 Tax=Peterkaempfera podocarpi TaxID=3232308 RepID=UPI00366DD1C5